MPTPHYQDVDPQEQEQDDDESFNLPLSLKSRCMKCYGWDDDFAGRALIGYRQFMQLKKQVEDWQADTLSPSLTIDFVWLQHISDVEHYVSSCMDYCGVLIGHNPEDGLDNSSAARRERIRATKLSRKLVFGNDKNVDEEVWSFGDDDVEEFEDTDDTPRSQSRRPLKDSQGTRRRMKSRHNVNFPDEQEDDDDRVSPRTVTTQQFENSRDMSRHMKLRRHPKQPKQYEDRYGYEDTDEEDYPDEYYDDDEEDDGFFDDEEERSDKIDKKKITVQVRDQKTGDTQRFRIRRHQKIVKLYQAYAEFNEIPLDKCRFFFQCERIGPDLTVGSIGLYHEATIEMIRQKHSIW